MGSSLAQLNSVEFLSYNFFCLSFVRGLLFFFGSSVSFTGEFSFAKNIVSKYFSWEKSPKIRQSFYDKFQN